jgi:hypothetical protein
MKKYLVFTLLLLLILVPAYSQDKGKEKISDKAIEKAIDVKAPAEVVTSDQLYSEITLEDFENTTYGEKDYTYSQSGEQKAEVLIRDQFPAPIPNSKKYLGVKIYGKTGDTISIIPPKKLITDKHCRSISVWVYGKNFSGELSMLIKDSEGKVHRLSFGKLNFLGWRKLAVTLTDQISQEDKFLAQKRQVEIIKIIYKPANTERLPIWNYFYLDDITARVREKYTDRQSDDW